MFNQNIRELLIIGKMYANRINKANFRSPIQIANLTEQHRSFKKNKIDMT